MVDLKKVTINIDGIKASITNITVEQAQEIWDRCSAHEHLDKALKKIEKMSFRTGRADLLGLRIKEVIRKAYHPEEVCPQCQGKGEVPNTSRWCVFEEEGPMTLKCLKFNKYVQNSNICRD